MTRLFSRQNYRDDAGYTLIEMFTICIIIGALAAIAIPVFLQMRDRGEPAYADSDLHTTAYAMDAYLSDAGAYGTAAQVVAGGEKPILSSGTSIVVVSHGAQTGFCLAALRNSAVPASAAQLKTTAVRWYDSQAGGLQPDTATGCPTTTGQDPGWQTDVFVGPTP